ncbi:RHS repeat protein, partial [Salmonella enterica subsp. enterica]|nr:RHS repeat protein [Salmonella enterica subsp. enterica]
AEQPYTPVAAITGRGESRKIWYYHTDLTGTVQEVTAADGTLVWAGYQAGFGENRGDISNSGAYFEQPLRLPGQYFDEETGLHYNLFRYYAPECGRFVSQDPIGLAGGLNLYRYAPNPLTHIDPLGLMDPFDLWYTQDTISDVFNQGPWKGKTIAEAIEQTKALGHLPDGLQISYERIIMPDGQEVYATLNNRTTYVAQQAGLKNIDAIDKNGKGLNTYNKLTDGGSRLPSPDSPDVKVKKC